MQRGAINDGTGTAQDDVYWWLKAHIGTLPRYEGTFLTELEVTQATGKSRTPVREALLRLEAEGFLQIMPKKGAFVPPIADSDVAAVMQARGLVETWAIGQLGPQRASLVPQLDRLIQVQKSLQNEPVEFIKCDREFHQNTVRAAGNPVLSDFYDTLREHQVRMGLRAIANSSDRVRTVLDEHQAIVDGIRSGDSLKAIEAVKIHLASTLSALQLPDVGRWSTGSAS